MNIWAISDLHLSFGCEKKSMSIFGKKWKNHAEKIEVNWEKHIKHEDLILLPGDLSWAMHLEDAMADLLWLHHLPGTKLLIKGNHDYWWPSISKLKEHLPSSIHALQNNAFTFHNVSIAGSRLWDNPEFNFDSYIDFQPNPKESKEEKISKDLSEKIFTREIERLKLSLSQLDPNATIRIAMTHYPPISADLQKSKVSKLLEEYKIDICVFGHLHSLKQGVNLFGKDNHIQYYLTSCDYLDFCPKKIL